MGLSGLIQLFDCKRKVDPIPTYLLERVRCVTAALVEVHRARVEWPKATIQIRSPKFILTIKKNIAAECDADEAMAFKELGTEQIIQRLQRFPGTHRYTGQVKLLITNTIYIITRFALCKDQCTVKNKILCGYGVAEAPPFSSRMVGLCNFFLSLFVLFVHLTFSSKFCTYGDTVPYRSPAQMSYRVKVGFSLFFNDSHRSELN
jgi:hypothetical protein